MILGLLAPWVEHTDASRELAQDIALAIDAHMKRGTAASLMGIHAADLSRQLAGRDPLNLWRLTSLPADFGLAFLAARTKRLGGEVLTADQLNLLKGAAAMGPRMLHAVIPAIKTRRQA
jgi:hypothetical protein